MNELGLEAISRNDTLTERVRVSLRKALIDGAFAPGERIKIREVAQALGVSPTPAREALMHLIAEGALLADTNKTALVPALTLDSLREITELRVSLETAAAAAAVDYLTDEDLAEIADHDKAGVDAAAANDMKVATEQNAAFHFGIYQHARMPLMVRMIETTWLRSGAYLAIAYPAFDMTRQGLTKHQAILAALRSRDASAVRATIEDDIRSSSKFLFESLRQHLQKSNGKRSKAG